MECVMECPDCKKRREVSARYFLEYRHGRATGRCIQCANKRQNPHRKAAKSRAAAAGQQVCRHCNFAAVNRSRGLCWRCYYTPGVLALYPPTSKYARRGVGNFSGAAPLAPAPTTVAPGTPEKVAVLEHRAKMKQAIFHPADARYEGDPRPLEFLKARATA